MVLETLNLTLTLTRTRTSTLTRTRTLTPLQSALLQLNVAVVGRYGTDCAGMLSQLLTVIVVRRVP